MIQEGRVDEGRRRGGEGGGAEGTAGKRGRVSWNAAVVPVYTRRSRAYARVFVYLCGTPENPVDERDGRPRERSRRSWRRRRRRRRRKKRNKKRQKKTRGSGERERGLVP